MNAIKIALLFPIGGSCDWKNASQQTNNKQGNSELKPHH